jgi:hypothetical protein
MKKSIGLYADTRNFKTTLPQTKHLNFFMQTNPQGYANGGQVRPGIPQSNMQVTSGFLPMALGFQEGGEAFSFGEIYGAIVKVVAGYLGKSEDDPQVQEEANKVAQTPEGQELAKKILAQNTEEEYLKASGVMESQPPLPTETFEGSTQEPPFGAVDVTPDPTLPKVPPQQQQRDFEDEQKPSDFVPPPKQVDPINPIPQQKFDEEEGIRGIPTERRGGFNFEDFFNELFKDKDAAPPLPKVTEEQKKRDAEDEQKGMPKADSVVPEIKPKPKPDSKGGIADFDVPDTEKEYRKAAGLDDPANKQTPKEAKETSNDLATLTGNKGKKDIPEWALPLASAGFAMMASKSPYFLQALGEAGQAGISTLQEQRGKKGEKELTDAQIEKLQAEAAFARGEGRQSKKTPDIIINDKGQRVYAVFDSKTNKFTTIKKADGTDMIAVRSRPEIEKYLKDITPNWDIMDGAEKQKLIEQELAKDLGIANTNIQSAVQAEAESGGGFSFPNFFKELFS